MCVCVCGNVHCSNLISNVLLLKNCNEALPIFMFFFLGDFDCLVIVHTLEKCLHPLLNLTDRNSTVTERRWRSSHTLTRRVKLFAAFLQFWVFRKSIEIACNWQQFFGGNWNRAYSVTAIFYLLRIFLAMNGFTKPFIWNVILYHIADEVTFFFLA